jgi:hypothetical protein
MNIKQTVQIKAIGNEYQTGVEYPLYDRANDTFTHYIDKNNDT